MTSEPGTTPGRGTVTTPPLELRCDDLSAALALFREQLGFRLDTIIPADDPAMATVSRGSVAVRLLREPDGARFRGVHPNAELVVPAGRPVLEISRLADDGRRTPWHVGRAGMQYRDLLPSRQGGRFIASHIRIPDGGPVADDVHHHDVRFQLIHCVAGWVRLVYEDQGEPFVLEAGDCVLQPPHIRHRVLESSPGLEVVEVGCPAVHLTELDHELDLPTPEVRGDRDFGGQRFVWHRAADATWQPWRVDGFECRDSGIGDATGGVAGVRVVRPLPGSALGAPRADDAELVFWFVLAGRAVLRLDDGAASEPLRPGDAVAVPGGRRWQLAEPSADFELLDVTLPAAT